MHGNIFLRKSLQCSTYSLLSKHIAFRHDLILRQNAVSAKKIHFSGVTAFCQITVLNTITQQKAVMAVTACLIK